MYSNNFEEVEHPILLKSRDVARLLSISERTLWSLAHRSDNPLPSIRIGRLIRYLPADVQVWVDAQREEAPR